MDERAAIQRDAGSNSDYLAVYRSHFANKMDMLVFGNPAPGKLPSDSRRIRISSYRSSLRSFQLVSHFKAAGGRFSRHHRPSRQAIAGNASRAEPTVFSNSRE